jgi:hypothetical protein
VAVLFSHLVLKEFDFLRVAGFRLKERLETYVQFERANVSAAIYHGRKSSELGFEVSKGGATYGLAAILAATNAPEATAYRQYAASSDVVLATGLSELSRLTQKYATRALSGDPAFFRLLEENAEKWAQRYALEVRAQQVKPRAETAFREKRYAEAAELYGSIAEALSPTELKKLSFARSQK